MVEEMRYYPKIKKLLRRTAADVDGVLQELTNALERSKDKGIFRITIVDDRQTKSHDLVYGSGKCRVRKAGKGRPNFEVRTDLETFYGMAEGQLSPIEAYYNGKMQIRGKLAYGRTILELIAAPGEPQFDWCF
jgi:putative sterol carrier protein